MTHQPNPQVLAKFPDGSEVLVTIFPASGHMMRSEDTVIEVAKRRNSGDTWGRPVKTGWLKRWWNKEATA